MHIQDEAENPGPRESANGMTHLVQDFRGLRIGWDTSQQMPGRRCQRVGSFGRVTPSGSSRRIGYNPTDHRRDEHLRQQPGAERMASPHYQEGRRDERERQRSVPQSYRETLTQEQEWERREQERNRQFADIQALSQRRRRRPIEPRGYPWNVTHAEMELTSSCNGSGTFKLWKQVMTYWFPSRAGFTVAENWAPPDPERKWTFNPVQLELAVMWGGNESPVAVVQIHPPGEEESGQESTETRLRASAEKAFERVAMWSSHPRLLMISGLGNQWNAFMGSTDLVAREGLIGEGSDWFGPSWKDSVTSEESFQIMNLCVTEIKSYLSL